ncbi:hypothetical protein KCV00_g338, partial [Aureobasidium melanogenum]
MRSARRLDSGEVPSAEAVTAALLGDAQSAGRTLCDAGCVCGGESTGDGDGGRDTVQLFFILFINVGALAGGLGIVVGLPLIRTVASLYRIQIRKAGGLLNVRCLRGIRGEGGFGFVLW